MKRYLVEFGASLALYIVLLVVSLRLLAHGVQPQGARIVVSLLPMLAGLPLCVAVVRRLGRIDELQRKIQLEALALAFTGTALLTFGYGFLENAGLPRLTMFVVWPLMAALWVLGLALGHLRYR